MSTYRDLQWETPSSNQYSFPGWVYHPDGEGPQNSWREATQKIPYFLLLLEAKMKVGAISWTPRRRGPCTPGHVHFISSLAYRPRPVPIPSWAAVCSSQGCFIEWWEKHHVHLLFSLPHFRPTCPVLAKFKPKTAKKYTGLIVGNQFIVEDWLQKKKKKVPVFHSSCNHDFAATPFKRGRVYFLTPEFWAALVTYFDKKKKKSVKLTLSQFRA